MSNRRSDGVMESWSVGTSTFTRCLPYFIFPTSDAQRTMRKSIRCLALCALLLAPGMSAEAQQPGEIPRIGFLSALSAPSMSTRMEAFRNGLHELGYVEGKNIVIESRYADGKLERLRALADELVRLKVHVIVT